MERVSPSLKYQYLLMERTYSPEQWISFEPYIVREAERIFELQKDYEYLLDCEEELMQEVFTLIFIHGTAFQAQVAKMMYDGLNQVDIAKQLGINQSNIHKAMKGNASFSNRIPHKKGVVYGGLKKKLIREVLMSNKIRKLMKEMYQTGTEGCRLYCYHTLIHHCFDSYQQFTQWLLQQDTSK
jgi:predicted transcriptional regulator